MIDREAGQIGAEIMMVAFNFCHFNDDYYYYHQLRTSAHKMNEPQNSVCYLRGTQTKRICLEHPSSQRGKASGPEVARSVVSAASTAFFCSLMGGLVRPFGCIVLRCWRVGRIRLGRPTCLALEPHESFVLANVAWVSSRRSVSASSFVPEH